MLGMVGGDQVWGQSCPLSFSVVNGLEGACPVVLLVLEGFLVLENTTGCCACFSLP